MRATGLAPRRQKQPIAQGVPLPAPVGGWDAISPLANMPVDRAIQLDNWIPRPGWIEPRRGYVTKSSGLISNKTPVQTLMAYNGANTAPQLFGVAGGTIYDCTNDPAIATSVTSLGSSRLQYVMFANPAAQYLMTVNGVDAPWSYDGTSWSQRAIVIGNSSGSILWNVNFVVGETIVLNGTTITFVAGSPGAYQVQIGASLSASIANLLAFLNASANANLLLFTYGSIFNNTLVLTAATAGTGGNALTLRAGYATGSIAFSVNPSNGDTITLNGAVVEFVTSNAGINQVNIGSALNETLSFLVSTLQNSTNGSINQFTYSISGGNTLLISAASPGILGNAQTIAASAATASGATLVGGSTAAASGQTLTGGGPNYGISPSTFIQVNSYMNRLWFIPTGSTNAVYLQTVGGVSGAASVFPLGQLMRRGGYLMAIGTWTVDTRQTVDEYIAFISSRGEIFVYSGTDPTTASTFGLVGIYQVGAPVGRRCFLRISGDLQIITVDGVVGMSEMLSTDRAAANRVALTSIIMNQMALAAQSYKNNFGWQISEFALGTLIILNIPVAENQQAMQFVMNTITGAWARFIGLDETGAVNQSYGMNANCWEVDGNDNVYFGGNNGTVYQWNVGSGDGSNPITCISKTAYNSFGNASQLKRYMMLQALITTGTRVIPSMGINVDFNDLDDLSTSNDLQGAPSLWNQVKWNKFKWGPPPVTTDNWISCDGLGHYVSVVTQITTIPNAGNPQATTTCQLNGWNITAESGAFV